MPIAIPDIAILAIVFICDKFPKPPSLQLDDQQELKLFYIDLYQNLFLNLPNQLGHF